MKRFWITMALFAGISASASAQDWAEFDEPMPDLMGRSDSAAGLSLNLQIRRGLDREIENHSLSFGYARFNSQQFISRSKFLVLSLDQDRLDVVGPDTLYLDEEESRPFLSTTSGRIVMVLGVAGFIAFIEAVEDLPPPQPTYSE